MLDEELAKLDQLDQRAERIEADYLRQVDEGNERAADFVARMLDRTGDERRSVQQRIDHLRAMLNELDQPTTNAMLDVYSKLRDSIRGTANDEADGLGALNDRLRAVFKEFRLEKVDKEVVGTLPVLRVDAIERFGSEQTTMLGGDMTVISEHPTSPATPVALFATGQDAITPPATALKVSLAQTGSGSQDAREGAWGGR